MDPEKIAGLVREYPGLARKREIPFAAKAMGSLALPGLLEEDGAFVHDKNGYLIAACDAIMPQLCASAPYFAGRSAVLASVNDVAAMGGKTLMLVNAAGGTDEENLTQIMRGMAEGAAVFGLPIHGGHLMPLGDPNSVCVTAVGRAKKILRSSTVLPGHALVVVAALSGQRAKSWRYGFDSTFCANPRTVRARYTAFRKLAEEGAFSAAKDISNPGVLGTLAVLLETSRVGALIDLDAIPVPEGMPREDWFLAFASFGFVCGMPQSRVKAVTARLRRLGVWAGAVGRATGDDRVLIKSQGQEALLFDWRKDSILRFA